MSRVAVQVILLGLVGCAEWTPPRPGLNEETGPLIASMALVSRPSDLSNEYLSRDDVAAFGQQLFFDQGLSAPADGGVTVVFGTWGMPTDGVSCADCHSPRTAFSDERALHNVSLALNGAWTKRNSPSLLNVATYTQFGWDGAADKLWAHGHNAYKGTMGGSPLRLVRSVFLRDAYRRRYSELFMRIPSTRRTSRWAPTTRRRSTTTSACSRRWPRT